jgi:hypothetical protein
MKRYLFTICFLLAATFSSAQFQLDWGYNFNSTTTSAGVNLYGYFIDVVTDDLGNIYALGSFQDSLDVDPGPGTHILISGGNNYGSMMMVKYRADGSFVWGNAFASPMTTNRASGIEIDSESNLHVVMNTLGQIDMDPGPGTAMIGDLSGTKWWTVLAKYDTTGALISTAQTSQAYAGFSTHVGHPELFVSASDSVYLMNGFEGSTDLDLGAGTFTVSTPARGMYVSILDKDHNFQNGFALEFQNWVQTESIVADSQGNIWASFYAYDSFDLDPGTGVTTVNAPAYNFGFDPGDNIAVKYNRDGTPQGFVQLKAGFGYLALKNDGGMLFYGVYNNLTDFDPGPGTMNVAPLRDYTGFIASYDAAFQNEWVGKFEHNFQGLSEVLSAYQSENGEIETCMYFTDRTDMDPGPAVTEEIGNPQAGGIALIGLDAQGDRIGHSLFNGDAAYKNSWVIFPGSDNSLMFMGQFRDTVDLDPGPGELLAISGTYPDGFLAKMNANHIVSVATALEVGDNWNVWPVPATNEIWVQSTVPSGDVVSISVIDMRGARVAAQTFFDAALPMQVTLGDLAEGIYFLEIADGEAVVRRKILVQGD